MPLDHHPPNPLDIPNKPDRHSFAILGERTLFLAHLPMFVNENHCYEVIVEAVLRGDVKERYLEQRRQHPAERSGTGGDDPTTLAGRGGSGAAGVGLKDRGQSRLTAIVSSWPSIVAAAPSLPS